METIVLQLLFSASLSLGAALILFPLMIKVSPKIGLVDIPNYRKFHRQPVPAIGGLVIVLSLIVVSVFSIPAHAFVFGHVAMFTAFVVIMVTGLIDDRLNISVYLRLSIQMLCAFAIAYDGTRITSLYGFAGIHHLSLMAQYLVTIFIITGITNAFNLIDGIDGLAGSIALINMVVLIILSIVMQNTQWLFLLLPLAVALVIFLKYNWFPARIFMGDSGSLTFGLVISAAGIAFIQKADTNKSAFIAETIVLVSGFCMIPVVDAIRVFYTRIKNGKSPFHADRTHIHHLLTKHYLVHSKATARVLGVHVTVLVLSAISVLYVSIYWVVLLQIVTVLLYMNFLRMMGYFYRWYRVIKKMEQAA